MAVSLTTSLTPTEEKADCFRLLALVVDGGCLVLRHRFDQVFPPYNLQNALNDLTTRGKLNKLFNKGILSKAQWGLLYPTVGQPCSAKFDVSLLACLLRYICGLNEQSTSWNGIPPSSDITTEADISRLKQYRNEVSHLQSISLNKNDFQHKWNELEQVITRLGKDVPNLKQEIQGLEDNCIDPVKEKFYQDTIEQWKKMDEMMKEEITSEVKRNKETIEEVKLKAEHVEQKLQAIQGTFDDVKETKVLYTRESSATTNTITVADLYITDSERDAIYVTTQAHKNAREKFDRTWCLILSGLPGEGKTTMAKKIISETTERGFARKLNNPSDWKSIPLNKKTPITIFIDDIFGAGALKERLLEGWSDLLPDIEMAVKSRSVKVVITTRHYIFKEAKERLKYLKILKDDNVQVLASHDLSDDERIEILKKHLIYSNREYDTELLRTCNDEYKRHSSIPSKIPPDFQYFRSMIGFPEVVNLFVKNEHLFSNGSYFFGQPYLFFKKCIDEIFLHKKWEKFLALILVWTSPHKHLKVLDVEPPNLSEAIKETVAKFGFELSNLASENLRESLQYHEGGFLIKDPYDGTLTFSHNSVKDMVGLVAGQKYQTLILQFADIEFLEQFVTTDEAKNDGLHILIEQFRYEDLNKVVCKMMNPTESTFKMPDLRIYYKFASYGTIYRFTNIMSVNTRLLEHDCFKQRRFVQIFCESVEGSHMLSRPVELLPRKCFDVFCDLDFGEEVAIYLPTLALLYECPLLIEEVFVQNIKMIHTTGFLKTSLLLASQLGFKNVIELLLHHGAIVDHDAIFLASANGHSDSLEYLLRNFSGNCTESPHSRNENSPLIAAAKRGEVECLHSLIRHGSDVNYRNKNGWSALDKAVIYAMPESCKILLDNKANLCKTKKYKRTPLHINADVGGLTVTEILLEYGASLTTKDYRGHYPIHCATFKNNVEIVDILLKADISNITQKHRVSYGKRSKIKGATLFHIAVLIQSVKLIECLLQNNLCPNIRDFYGRTPLYLAVYVFEKKKDSTIRMLLLELKGIRENDQQYDLIKKLCEHSDAHIPDNNGYTPLHAAVHKGQIELVKLLAPLSDVNARDKYGKTPLHTACDKMDFHIFKILVEDYRADYRMRTKSGQTIFDILAKKTEWRNIRRRYQNQQRVTKYMVQYPRFRSFREIIEMKDRAFVEEVTRHLVLSEHPKDKLFQDYDIDSDTFYSYLDNDDTA